MNRKELVQTLELVKPALADNDLVPVFQCFMFEDGTVTATNDQIAIVGACDVKGTFAVDGKTLLGLLQASASNEVEFNLPMKEAQAANEVLVKTGRSTFRLPYQPKENFLFKAPDMSADAALNAKFVEGLSACLLTSSKDNTQPALMGVSIDNFNLYSCDGDAVTRYKLPSKHVKPWPSRMVPNGFCEAVVAICKTLDSTKGSFSINDEWAGVWLNDERYTIYGRIIKVDKPIDYEDLIKKTLKSKPVFVPVPNRLDGALTRARVVADPESAKTQVAIDGNKMALVTETHMGVVRDIVTVEGGEAVNANISAALMQRAIGLCDQMAIMENCTAYRKDQYLFQLLSNMG